MTGHRLRFLNVTHFYLKVFKNNFVTSSSIGF